MIDVDNKKVISINDYINKDDFDIFGNGPLVMLKEKGAGLKIDKNIPHIKVFEKNEIPPRFHYVNDNTLDYLLLADAGYMMDVNIQKKDALSIVGMHGYDPDNEEMHGIFYAYGESFKKQLKIDSFELIHIYPLMCKILNIPEGDDIDGDFNIIKGILN